MKAKISIDQKNAVRVGSNLSGDVIIDFNPADLTEGERDELSRCDISGDVFKVTPNFWSSATTADIAGLKIAIGERIAEREKKESNKRAENEKTAADIDAACRAFIAAPIENRIYIGSSNPITIYKISFGNFDFPYDCNNRGAEIAKRPGGQTAIAEAESECARRNSEEKRKYDDMVARNKAAAEAKSRTEAEAAERRKTQIAAWVGVKGTENQKARLRDRLLPDDEVIDAIRAETYADLDGFPRYQKIKANDVCDGYDDYAGGIQYHDVDFDVAPADALTAEQYDRLQEIRKSAPEGAMVEARIHAGKCDECDITVARIGFMVRVKVGELEFSREYGMDAE